MAPAIDDANSKAAKRRTQDIGAVARRVHQTFDPRLVGALNAAGHEVEVLGDPFSDTMGHAGALVRHPNGVIEGAADPRSHGVVAGV